jgi:hypothetical protein
LPKKAKFALTKKKRMKKIFTLLLLIPFLGVLAQPTCGYDHNFIVTHPRGGVWPDSAVNFVSGTVGVPYTQNITVVVPKDTNATIFGNTQTFHFTHIDLQTNITTPVNYGLPPGLSLAGTPANFQFPGNDSSCMIIYGTPTTAGSYSLSFTLKAYVQEFPGVPVSTQVIKYYIINIAPATGIATNANVSFAVMQNIPNPVKDNTNIKFTSPSDGKAKLTMFNVAGQKIAEREMSTVRGDNSFDFDASQLENGVYLYTVEMNQQKQCRRMVVAR